MRIAASYCAPEEEEEDEIEKAVGSSCKSQERAGGAAEEERRGITVILPVTHPSSLVLLAIMCMVATGRCLICPACWPAASAQLSFPFLIFYYCSTALEFSIVVLSY